MIYTVQVKCSNFPSVFFSVILRFFSLSFPQYCVGVLQLDQVVHPGGTPDYLQFNLNFIQRLAVHVQVQVLSSENLYEDVQIMRWKVIEISRQKFSVLGGAL